MNGLGGKAASVLLLVSLASILTLFLVYSEQGLARWKELEREKARLAEASEDIAEENRRLVLQIERLKNDPIYIEEEARLKLGLIRPNETIYRLGDEDDTIDGPRPVL